MTLGTRVSEASAARDVRAVAKLERALAESGDADAADAAVARLGVELGVVRGAAAAQTEAVANRVAATEQHRLDLEPLEKEVASLQAQQRALSKQVEEGDEARRAGGGAAAASGAGGWGTFTALRIISGRN
jgi:hypothetical protein